MRDTNFSIQVTQDLTRKRIILRVVFRPDLINTFCLFKLMRTFQINISPTILHILSRYHVKVLLSCKALLSIFFLLLLPNKLLLSWLYQLLQRGGSLAEWPGAPV